MIFISDLYANVTMLTKCRYLDAKTLEELAKVKIAVILWHKNDIREKITDVLYTNESDSLFDLVNFDLEKAGPWESITSDIVELLEKLPLSRKIDDFPYTVDRVGFELKQWIEYQDEQVFYDRKEFRAMSLMDDVIWRSEGLIDYAKSAEMMMNHEMINEKEKFRIACLYCLEDEVKQLRTRVDRGYKKKVKFSEHPLMYYWCSFVKDDLAQVKKMISADFEGSIDEYMLTLCRVNNRSGIIYFWNKLDKAKQFDVLIKNIDNLDPYAEFVMFSRLSVDEQLELFNKVGAKFFTNLLNHPYCAMVYAGSVVHFMDVMTEEQYREIFMRTAGEIHALDVITEADSGTYFQNVNMMELLWKHTPANMKKYVFEKDDGIAILLVMRNILWENSSDEMFTLFADMEYDLIKKVVFHAEAMSFVYEIAHFNHQVKYLCEFMKRILKPEDMIRFDKEYAQKLAKMKHPWA